MNHKIVLFNEKKDCCGCGACLNICPKGAIYMEHDKNGFIYPKISDKKCIECTLCKKVCAYQKNVNKTNIICSYVGSSKNTDRLHSASGGIFSSIAINIINEKGIVYGASMEEIDGILTPMHIGIETKEQLWKLQGSKYVHSEIGTIYNDVKEQLKSGRLVLFSGTPCQIDGLNAFLNYKKYENLLSIDIICHGVPSKTIFQDYIRVTENKLNRKIVDFKFRDKSIGWGLNGKVKYKDKKGLIEEKIVYAGESSYYKLFLESEIYRENCYSCKYANENRVGDITLGDYWGIEYEHPELIKEEGFNHLKGISCIIVNTQIGNKYINKYTKDIQLWPTEFEKIARHNKQLSEPSEKGKNRNKVLDIYQKDGYQGVEDWFNRKNRVKLLLVKLKNRLKYISISKNINSKTGSLM